MNCKLFKKSTQKTLEIRKAMPKLTIFHFRKIMMNKKLPLVAVGATLLLAGCPSVHSPLGDAAKGGSWVNLGVSTNSNVLHELDKNSIKKNGTLVTFRDRKTIEDLSKAHFANTPAHKVSMNTWEVNCKNKTYSLVSIQLFDKGGQSIYKQDYDKSNRTFMSITRGSPSEKQVTYVCK